MVKTKWLKLHRLQIIKLCYDFQLHSFSLFVCSYASPFTENNIKLMNTVPLHCIVRYCRM